MNISLINDNEIIDYSSNKELNLLETTNKEKALKGSKYIVICTPTNYDSDKNYFDTSSVESEGSE